MKQVDKVVKKGEYYEMQVVDDGLFSIKPHKKEEMQSAIQINSDSILTDLPSFSQARSQYHTLVKNQFQTAEPDELLYQLEDILVNQKLADQDKQEIVKLIRQVKVLKEEPLVPLIQLTPIKRIKQKQPEPMHQVELKMNVDIKELQHKVAELQKFSYPELTSLEHQLEVLLGKKEMISHSKIPKDDRNKEEIDQIYALLSSLSCAQNLTGLVDRIHANSAKYNEIGNWAHQMEKTSEFHLDFLAELNQDELLLNKIEQNFKANILTVRKTIQKLKLEDKK